MDEAAHVHSHLFISSEFRELRSYIAASRATKAHTHNCELSPLRRPFPGESRAKLKLTVSADTWGFVLRVRSPAREVKILHAKAAQWVALPTVPTWRILFVQACQWS